MPRRCSRKSAKKRSLEAGAAICALPASTSTVASPCKRKFTWILWCTPGYSISDTFLQTVLLTMLPSISTQRRYYQAGERGKTHVFDVLVVSFVRGSARPWPAGCSVIHCMPGSGYTSCHVGSHHSRAVELTCSVLSALSLEVLRPLGSAIPVTRCLSDVVRVVPRRWSVHDTVSSFVWVSGISCSVKNTSHSLSLSSRGRSDSDERNGQYRPGPCLGRTVSDMARNV